MQTVCCCRVHCSIRFVIVQYYLLPIYNCISFCIQPCLFCFFVAVFYIRMAVFLYKRLRLFAVLQQNKLSFCFVAKKFGRDNSAVLFYFVLAKATAFHVFYLSSTSFSPCRCQNNLSNTFNCCAMAITTPFISMLSVNHGSRMYRYAQKDVSTGVSVVKN